MFQALSILIPTQVGPELAENCSSQFLTVVSWQSVTHLSHLQTQTKHW